MTLGDLRRLFTKLICEHVLWINSVPGYAVAIGEGMDRKTDKDPTTDHMVKSLHEVGLAQDLDLYYNGAYQKATDDHKFSGLVWEKRHPLCRWGGRFGEYSFRIKPHARSVDTWRHTQRHLGNVRQFLDGELFLTPYAGVVLSAVSGAQIAQRVDGLVVPRRQVMDVFIEADNLRALGVNYALL